VSKLTLSFKGQLLKVFPIHSGRMIVGNDPAAEIYIDSLAIAAQHIQIDTEQQSTRIKALSQENGTFINNDGEKVNTHQLKDGDSIRLGKHTLTYTFEEVSEEDMLQAINNVDVNLDESIHDIARPKAVKKAETAPVTVKEDGWLQIMSGQNLGKTLSLHRSMTNLGKPGLATAVIAHRKGGYFISHLEGKIPLQINSHPTNQTTKLNPDDIIQIGNIKMQFYLE